MSNDLIFSIRKQLDIPKSADNDWICQIVYSSAGEMALASLWDHYENSEAVSVQHFKRRVSQLFDAYIGLYPALSYTFPEDRTNLVDEIYSIYLRNGFFYHSPFHISPALPANASVGNLVLHRGHSPDAKLLMSGLGFYSVQPTFDERSVVNMFGLQEITFDSYLSELLLCGEWESVVWPENTEYLRLDPPFRWGYWQNTPVSDGRISLARYGDPNKVFVLYRFHNGNYQQKAIPEWRIRDYFSNDGGHEEYRRIATALLQRYDTLPHIKVSFDNQMVEIKLGYRLPPAEEAFFKLYSWPLRYDFTAKTPQVFTRKMAKQVFPIFRHTLETLGYCFMEE